MIEIFPNLLDGGPCDTQTTNRRMSIAEWLDDYCSLSGGYKPGDFMPALVKLDEEVILQEDWPTTYFRPKDYLEVRAVPQGTDPFSITAALFGGIRAIFGMLMPKLPGTPNAPGQGQALGQGSVRGNKVKLGEPVRESFGTQKIYPDYLLPPHKYFSDRRTQQIRFHMNIGVGQFQINADNVKVGETAILALGAEAEYQIYQPGAITSGDPSCVWWHTAPEVGSSSTGAAGLELTASTALTPNVVASSINFNAYTVTIPLGAGTFPTDWDVGMTIRMVVPYTYTVTDGGGAARDVITGPLAMLAPFVGQSVEIVGTNAGLYIVNSWDGTNLTLNFAAGGAANSLVLGSGSATIGPAGLRYRILSIGSNVMTVERLTSSGSTDVSFPGFDNTTLTTASISLDGSSLEGGWRGPFPACPAGEITQNLEWDVFLPEGLVGVGAKGDFYSLEVSYELQYRDMDIAGAWTSVPRSLTDNTLDQIGDTQNLALPYPMRPEVRMRKTGPMAQNIEWRSTIQWLALKCTLPMPASYPQCTTISGRIQISDRISSQSESQINVIATRMLPVRSGGVWLSPQATRDVAPPFIYVAKSVGLTDADIDLMETDRLADGIWATRADHVDMAVTEESTTKEVLNNILGCGFSEVTLDRGLLRPVRDEPRTVLEHGYSAQNMTEELVMESDLKSANDFDGVQVTYQDSTTWTEEVVDCRLPSDPLQGMRVDKISAPGITDRNKAYQFGMRRRRIHEYRRDRFSFSTPGDALNSRYLSYCAVCSDIPGYGQSALLLEYLPIIGGAVLTSSEPLNWDEPGVYLAALRRKDGTLSGPYVATRIDDFTFSVPPLDFVPDVSWDNNEDPPHILFGPTVSWVYKVLVTSISPKGVFDASVEMVGYDDRVYLSDDATAP